jgi:hypothetical protein
MGARLTIADKYSPQILDGVFIAGMSGDLDQGYSIANCNQSDDFNQHQVWNCWT